MIICGKKAREIVEMLETVKKNYQEMLKQLNEERSNFAELSKESSALTQSVKIINGQLDSLVKIDTNVQPTLKPKGKVTPTLLGGTRKKNKKR